MNAAGRVNNPRMISGPPTVSSSPANPRIVARSRSMRPPPTPQIFSRPHDEQAPRGYSKNAQRLRRPPGAPGGVAVRPTNAVEAPRAAAGSGQVQKEEAVEKNRIAAVSMRERASLQRAHEEERQVHHRKHQRE